MTNEALAGFIKKEIRKSQSELVVEDNKAVSITTNGTTVISPSANKDVMEAVTVTTAVPAPVHETNKEVTVDVSQYESAVEITPSENKDVMDKVTVTLSNIPQVYDVVSTPTFSEESGAVESGTTVELACATGGATIYYTTNGDTPDLDSTVYENAIEITAEVTIKAIAFAKGKVNSSVASATYTISE